MLYDLIYLNCCCSDQRNLAITRRGLQFWLQDMTGYLKTIRFYNGINNLPVCRKCNTEVATEQHLHYLVRCELLMRPTFVMDMFKANDLLYLI